MDQYSCLCCVSLSSRGLICFIAWTDCTLICRSGIGSSIGDWWVQLDGDAPAGSTTQLHQPMVRDHEFTSSLLQLEMAQGLNRGKYLWDNSSLSQLRMSPISITLQNRAFDHLHAVWVYLFEQLKWNVKLMLFESSFYVGRCFCKTQKLTGWMFLQPKHRRLTVWTE